MFALHVAALEQIFANLSPAERAFACETCVYPVLDVDVLNEIPQYRRRAAHLVDRFRKSGGFLQSLDSCGRRFAYHDDARRFLERELRKTPLDDGSDRFLATLRSAGANLALAARGIADERRRAQQTAQALHCFGRAESRSDILRILRSEGHGLVTFGYADVVETSLAQFAIREMRSQTALLTLKAAVASRRSALSSVEHYYRDAIELETDAGQRSWNRLRYAEALAGMRDREAIEVLRPLLQSGRLREDPALGQRALAILATAHAKLGEHVQAFRYLAEAERLRVPAVSVAEGSPLRVLSNAELHLLTLAARQSHEPTVEELAGMIRKGVNTVKTQLAAIRAKLGVKTKREAIDVARGCGVG